MNLQHLSVREIELGDIEQIKKYWLTAGDDYLQGLGVDISKMPSANEWNDMLSEQIRTPVKEKKSYCIIWELNGKAVGHSNINKIIFGEEAYMHIHIWNADVRKKGFGSDFIKMTVPYFFEKYKLKKLYCEPYAVNPAPNKTLEKVGFNFLKSYVTTPGWLNFEQQVNLWKIDKEMLSAM